MKINTIKVVSSGAECKTAHFVEEHMCYILMYKYY